MTALWFSLGGAIFGLLGLLHAIFTLADTRRPRRLVPDDPTVRAAMAGSGVRLARGGTTMWRAWVGFNLSHSLGALLFCALCILLGLAAPALALPRVVLLLPAVVAGVYLGLSICYWFIVPTVGVALATLCLLIGWLVY